MSTWRVFCRRQTSGRCGRCCGRICTRTGRGEAAAMRLLNDAQRREAHNLMGTTLPATRATDCGVDCAARGRVGWALATGAAAHTTDAGLPAARRGGQHHPFGRDAMDGQRASAGRPEGVAGEPRALAPGPERAAARGDGPRSAHSLLRADDPRRGEFYHC